MNTYKIIVDGDKSFDFSSKDADSLDSISLQENKFQVLKDNVSYQTEILSADFLNRNYTVLVNGNEYEVNIARPLDQLIKEMGFEVGAGKQVNAIKAPMPGLILSIHVEVGQEVQENETLLILEAMKMENNFASPRAGIIKSILVKNGDAVEKGQLLIEFE